MKYSRGMRFFHKKNYALVALIVVVFIVTMGHNYSAYSGYIQSTSKTREIFSRLGSLDLRKQTRRIYLHQPNLPDSYQNLLSKYSIDDLLQLTKKDRCDLYFNDLPADWSLPNFQDDFSYDVDIFNGKKNFKTNYNKITKESPDTDLDTVVNMIFDEVEKKSATNKVIESELLDAVYKFRTYASCYIQEETSNNAKEIAEKMFPWFTFKSPVYERWDGTIVNDYANMRAHYPDSKYKNVLSYDPTTPFWNRFQKEIYGKGIVFSISDKFVPDAINLIKLLRYHQNKYPIQFVHKGDLSKESQRKLIEISRKHIILEDSVTLNDFKQDIWFVNTEACLTETFKDYFKSYTNKWLCVLFNTYEEMMLMDTDVALFASPEYFFSIPDYREKGAFFFKDRYGIDSVHEKFPKLWLQMFPSMMETTLFSVPQLTNHTLNNEFFTKNSRHIVEAGIVLMNRRSHFPGLLLSTQIQLWQPLTVKLHGEKDLFWLGQSMMGNEDYAFNKHFSGAAGVLEEKDFEVSNLVVSAAPAHLDSSDNHTLLWINSGLSYCKKNSWEHDAKNVFEGKFTEEELKKKYQSTITIDALIVPPEVWKLRDDKSNDLDPEAKEPSFSWRLRWDLGCGGYLWSAHSVVDGVKGLEVRYNEEEKAQFAKIAKVWGANIMKATD